MIDPELDLLTSAGTTVTHEHVTLLTQAAAVIRAEYRARVTAGKMLHQLDPSIPESPESDVPEQIARQLDRIVELLMPGGLRS